jgi:hypothetical protein
VQLGPENPIATVLIALMSAAWLVAIWAILRMQLSALKKRGSLWLFGSSVPLASYNRNASRLFAASLLFAIAVAILLFALTSAGYIPRNRVGAPSRDSTSMPLAGNADSGQSLGTASADVIPATSLKPHTVSDYAAMNLNFFSTYTWLSGEEFRGYLARPIPQPRDSDISNVLRAWMALDEVDRNQSEVSGEQRWTMLSYSERMAALAVRERSQDLITLGLIALGVDGWNYDWRDNVLIVALHYDAAKRIGASPEDVFESAARLLPDKPASGLRSFLRRSAHDKSLEVMGYIVGNDEDGIRYQRTW